MSHTHTYTDMKVKEGQVGKRREIIGKGKVSNGRVSVMYMYKDAINYYMD